jgi:uncharacterized circularly permuted ATP-grasp superfamily protein/uncharacterized alpha-E superfamily protein
VSLPRRASLLVPLLSDAPNEPFDLDTLLAGYAAAAATFDEMLAGDGTIRPHWRTFVDGFAALGPEGRAAAGESTRQLLRESGIAFNVYADPDDRQHAWRLDLVPVFLPEQEWDVLAAGILQRARLIDAVLADLHGGQTLVRDGSLPASLLLGSPAFVRTSVERDGPPRRFLYAYACDVARTAAGGWVVLGDQTDTAIGNGYVLASRVALSHGLAELFRDCHTKRLAGYYLGLQESFQALCRRDDGRIVILSPGPDSASYFSHAYLARYLGYTIVESGDLTVRDNQLYLKTLDGLQRVYLVVCKQPGHLLDPLHLPGSGLAGIPGLVQAARSGNVTLVNRLGSGAVRNHALGAFAASLFPRVLGEAPLLPDITTVWLGDAANRRAVLGAPGRWAAVKAIARNDPGEPSPTLGPGALSPPARRTLEDRIASEGHRWVGVEPVALATTPVFDGGRLVPAPYAFRTYVVAGEGGYQILPGGLVRLAGGPTTAMLPNGFGSKDLWITAARPERPGPSLLRTTMREVHLRRTGRDLLSRTADNLFWLGRYGERAEGTMRLLRSVLSRFLEDGRPDSNPVVLQRLLRLQLRLDPATPEGDELPPWDAVERLVGILMHEARPYALRDSLDQLHRTATLVRDQISHDAWRMLNGLHIDRRWRQPRRAGLAWPLLELLDDGIRALNAFSGTEAENMTRNFAWRFLEIGRRIERSRQLSELTRELVCGEAAAPENDGSLRLLLELGDSYMTYRSRYLITPLTAPVVDLLLLDETNPRGIAFQLRELDEHFALLPSEGPHRSPGQRLILRLLTGVRLAEVEDLCKGDETGRLSRLDQLLTELMEGLPQLSDVIGRSYFAHAETPVATLVMRRRDEP